MHSQHSATLTLRPSYPPPSPPEYIIFSTSAITIPVSIYVWNFKTKSTIRYHVQSHVIYSMLVARLPSYIKTTYKFSPHQKPLFLYFKVKVIALIIILRFLKKLIPFFGVREIRAPVLISSGVSQSPGIRASIAMES